MLPHSKQLLIKNGIDTLSVRRYGEEKIKNICILNNIEAYKCYMYYSILNATTHIAEVLYQSKNGKQTAEINVPSTAISLNDLFNQMQFYSFNSIRMPFTILFEDSEKSCSKLVENLLKHIVFVLTLMRYGGLINLKITPENIYYDEKYGFILVNDQNTSQINIYSIFSMKEENLSIYSSDILRKIANGKKTFISTPEEFSMYANTNCYSLAIIAIEMIYSFFYSTFSEVASTFSGFLKHFNNGIEALNYIESIINLNKDVIKHLKIFLSY